MWYMILNLSDKYRLSLAAFCLLCVGRSAV